MTRSSTRTALALAILALAGCRDTTGPGGAGGLLLTPDTVRVLVGGPVVQLRADRADTTAGPLPGPVTWESSDVAVVQVSPTGEVHALGEGTARITARSGRLSGTAEAVVSAFATITAGGMHACGLTSDGAAWCWGHNHAGQLGDGTQADSDIPVAVMDGHRFEVLEAGNWHTCGVTTQGATWCWGENGARRQRFLPAHDVFQVQPAPVAGGHRFVALDAGDMHTCGLTAAGDAYCWGHNEYGQLGDGVGTDPSETPVPVAGGRRFLALGAGGLHSCGLTTDREAWCWGYNAVGQLARGANDTLPHPAPAPVVGGHAFEALAAGSYASCAIDAAGRARCWGWDLWLQVGDGPDHDICPIGPYENPCRTAPSAVHGDIAFARLSGGNFHNCGITAAGEVYCWGDNGGGRLGVPGAGWASDRPLRVPGLFRAVSAGGIHTCVIELDGRGRCLGGGPSGAPAVAAGGSAGRMGTGVDLRLYGPYPSSVRTPPEPGSAPPRHPR